MLKPEHPRDPEFQDALRDARARLLPGRRVRRAAAAVGARHPAARLGQPALLGAARLARRRSGAARDLGRRRGHRRDHVPDRQGARRRADVRRDDRDDPARRHRRRPARRGSPRAAPGCWCRPSTASRTARSRRAPQPADGVSFAPKITVEDARVDWTEPAVAIDRRVRACTPAPGAWTTYAGERIKLGPRHARPTATAAAGRARWSARTPSSSAPAPPRSGSARSRRSASKQMAAADWARGVRARARRAGARRLGSEHGPTGDSPTTSTRSARRCPRSSSAPRGATGRRGWCRRAQGQGFVLVPRAAPRPPSTRRRGRSTTTCS